MIWLDNKGMTPGNNIPHEDVTVGGADYTMYLSPTWSSHGGSYIAFVGKQPMTSGSLPIHEFMKHLPSDANVADTDYLVSIELGNEVIKGNGATTLNSFNVSILQTVNGACGSAVNNTFTSVPTADLCAAGAPTTVTGAGPWSWTCQRLNGGSDATCGAALASHALTVTVSGTGTVTSAPQNNGAIACTGSGSDCFTTFLHNTEVTLTASPSSTTFLYAWGVDCSGNDPACKVTMDGDRNVSATFAPLPPFKVIGVPIRYFPAWGDFYGPVVSSGQFTVHVKAGALDGPLLFNRQIDVTLKSGYADDFGENPGLTTIGGPLTVGLGSLTVENVVVK
jgi:hypothetical protein